MTEHEELLAAMYDEDDEEKQLEPKHTGEIKKTARSTTVNINGQIIEIPNMQYVDVLEKTIRMMAKDLERITTILNTTRGFIRKQSGQISTISRSHDAITRDLDNKINRQDLP